MDHRRFDSLARALAGSSSRRGALAALLGIAAGAGIAPDASARRRRRCRPACASGQTCVHGECRCDDGGSVCGAQCCPIGQSCRDGRCVEPPQPACIAFGQPCKDVGVPCCDGLACGSGQGGKSDVACYRPAGAPCQSTAECTYASTCQQGICAADPQPTPQPPLPCLSTVPVTADAGANGRALQQAVIDAEDGDTIVLASGDYRFDDMQPGADFIAGIYVTNKEIAIERCNAEAIVNLICPASGTLSSCVVVNHPIYSSSPASLSLRGVTLSQLVPGGFGSQVFNAELALEDTVLEVSNAASTPLGVEGGDGRRSVATVGGGVVFRTASPAPTAPALDARAVGGNPNTSVAIACDTLPTYDGYSGSSARCFTFAQATITPSCGCA